MFLKPRSALIADGAAIARPAGFERVDYEGELGVVIGKGAARVSKDDALDIVLGYTCVNDVTVRDLQKKDGQWTRAKGFDTFCPIGEPGRVPNDLSSLTVVTRVNGAERQRGTAMEMIFAIPDLLAYVSNVMTLEPDDVVATGTLEVVAPDPLYLRRPDVTMASAPKSVL